MSEPIEKSPAGPEPATVRGARLGGRIVQAVALAAFLVLAFMKLLMYAGASVVFRYQGF